MVFFRHKSHHFQRITDDSCLDVLAFSPFEIGTSAWRSEPRNCTRSCFRLTYTPFIVELQSPFFSFLGKFTCYDYESGHKISISIWLRFFYRPNFFITYDETSSQNVHDYAANHRREETEEIIALLVVPTYLSDIYALQYQYSLELVGFYGV
ncbi:unnamed protein product [Tilletia controversa]|nr:unnamed protein product [Tilletia caries]CAD6904384.1 unnamed protein product [Tilletia controversa]CAD6897320.1 unnamed protein product [Tilletia caries]CAD6907178.1 unnamed protein product [Tilletia controversa]CAD6934797.1 unnamed protein product [Tilletia caries]